MSLNADRASAVRQLAFEYECLTPELVTQRLGCGRGQAMRAIRQAREDGSADGELWSYATRANDYTVAVEGDPLERVLSWTAREQDVITRSKNTAKVMSAALARSDASKAERAIAKMAAARQKDAEADELRVDAIKELLGS